MVHDQKLLGAYFCQKMHTLAWSNWSADHMKMEMKSQAHESMLMLVYVSFIHKKEEMSYIWVVIAHWYLIRKWTCPNLMDCKDLKTLIISTRC